MTDTINATSAPRAGGIDKMLLPELKHLASSLGIKGASGLRKGALVEAITTAQSGGGSRPARAEGSRPARTEKNRPQSDAAPSQEQAAPPAEAAQGRTDRTADGETGGQRRRGRTPRTEPAQGAESTPRTESTAGVAAADPSQAALTDSDNRGGDDVASRLDALRAEGGGRNRRRRNDSTADAGEPSAPAQAEPPRVQSQPQRDSAEDDFGSGRRGRRRRNRDRQGQGQGQSRRPGSGGANNRGGGFGLERMEAEPVVGEDDVVVEISGILDVLDNYAFVRTSGYLPGPNDAYVSLSIVRRYGLRKGDLITGSLKQPKDGERREKFNPLVQLDTVNGGEPEAARNRPEFAKLTPLYPQERLRLEDSATNMTGRIVDLVAPIGKGQRGLIVSPPKAGKTMVMQAIANAITANHPEVHLMVVLVDERPEEVTDFQRTTSGEVIASTFDRPADDHTVISEMAIERAKRLVEQGRDVVILLDGITRLGRAYNLAAPASGRILSGGVDSAALYPPKKFFGAARNIEDGGSLTILATALIETGSKMDEVIFEEFKGTGNMELRLRRDLADKRIFPAIDVDASGTRREELLLGREELAIIWKLRRVLSGMEDQAALEMLLKQLRKTQSNHEFLVQISRTTP